MLGTYFRAPWAAFTAGDETQALCEGTHDGQMFLAIYVMINTFTHSADRKGSLE